MKLFYIKVEVQASNPMTSNEHLKSICIIQIFHKPFFAPYFVAKKCTNHVFVLPQLSPPFPAAGRSIRSQLLGVFLVEYVIYGSDVVPGQTSLSASEHTGKRNCKKKWRCALAVWRRHFHDNWDALDCPRNKWVRLLFYCDISVVINVNMCLSCVLTSQLYQMWARCEAVKTQRYRFLSD